LRETFVQLAWVDVTGLEDALPDWAGTLNCDRDDEPSSDPVPVDPDVPDEDDEADDGVVLTDGEALAA
jgi:hypothetical protein